MGRINIRVINSNSLYNAFRSVRHGNKPPSVRRRLVYCDILQPFRLVSLEILIAQHIDGLIIYTVPVSTFRLWIGTALFLIIRNRITHPQRIGKACHFLVIVCSISANSLRIGITVFKEMQITHILVHLPVEQLETFAPILGVFDCLAL